MVSCDIFAFGVTFAHDAFDVKKKTQFDSCYLLDSFGIGDTVKLGYNEHSVITNKFFSPNWSFYYIKQPGYNETRL